MRGLRRALDVDVQRAGSPVYKEVVGLEAVDWYRHKTRSSRLLRQSSLKMEAARRFGKVERSGPATSSRADYAPTESIEARVVQASDALAYHRFEAALPVLDDLLESIPYFATRAAQA